MIRQRILLNLLMEYVFAAWLSPHFVHLDEYQENGVPHVEHDQR